MNSDRIDSARSLNRRTPTPGPCQQAVQARQRSSDAPRPRPLSPARHRRHAMRPPCAAAPLLATGHASTSTERTAPDAAAPAVRPRAGPGPVAPSHSPSPPSGLSSRDRRAVRAEAGAPPDPDRHPRPATSSLRARHRGHHVVARQPEGGCPHRERLMCTANVAEPPNRRHPTCRSTPGRRLGPIAQELSSAHRAWLDPMRETYRPSGGMNLSVSSANEEVVARR